MPALRFLIDYPYSGRRRLAGDAPHWSCPSFLILANERQRIVRHDVGRSQLVCDELLADGGLIAQFIAAGDSLNEIANRRAKFCELFFRHHSRSRVWRSRKFK